MVKENSFSYRIILKREKILWAWISITMLLTHNFFFSLNLSQEIWLLSIWTLTKPLMMSKGSKAYELIVKILIDLFNYCGLICLPWIRNNAWIHLNAPLWNALIVTTVHQVPPTKQLDSVWLSWIKNWKLQGIDM